MQQLINRYRYGVLATVFLLFTALPGHAQFGGVFTDPVQSGHALQQIAQQVKDSATWQQQLANTIKLLATADKDFQQAVTTYNMIHGNLKNFNSKSIWRTIQSQLTMASFANQYGETTGLQAAMNGQSPGTASLFELPEPTGIGNKPRARYSLAHGSDGWGFEPVLEFRG
jgi:hypothetical protein